MLRLRRLPVRFRPSGQYFASGGWGDGRGHAGVGLRFPPHVALSRARATMASSELPKRRNVFQEEEAKASKHLRLDTVHVQSKLEHERCHREYMLQQSSLQKRVSTSQTNGKAKLFLGLSKKELRAARETYLKTKISAAAGRIFTRFCIKPESAPLVRVKYCKEANADTFGTDLAIRLYHSYFRDSSLDEAPRSPQDLAKLLRAEVSNEIRANTEDLPEHFHVVTPLQVEKTGILTVEIRLKLPSDLSVGELFWKSGNKKVDIIHQDRWIVVVDKPSGLCSVPGVDPSLESVQCMVQQYVQGAHAVHRLDSDTSGILVIALVPYAARVLGEQLRLREAEKLYLALCSGWISEDCGVINLPLEKDPECSEIKIKQRVASREGASNRAKTEWKTIRREVAGEECWPENLKKTEIAIENGASPRKGEATGRCHTLVQLKPITGRTHQLRVHMQAIGHPIVGDPIYGTESSRRLKLHAHLLKIRHPDTKQEVIFQSPCEFAPDISLSF